MAALAAAASVIAACSSTPAGQHEPTRPSPADSVEHDAVCTTERPPPPDTSFLRDGKRCGCHDGKMRCRNPARQKCFFDGLWYSKFWELRRTASYQGTPIPELCYCRGFDWDCTRTDTDVLVGRSPKVRFAVGQADLTAEAEQRIDATARQMHDEPDVAIALVGILNPQEGEQAAELARRRVDVVRNAYVSRGVSEERVTIDAVESGKFSWVRIRLILQPPE